jgi:hypothetical protein
MKMWRVLFFFCGGIGLVIFICWKIFREAREIMPEYEFKISGLEGLLSRYQAEKNTAMMTAIFAPAFFLVCGHFVRSQLSFIVCLSALIAGLPLINSLFGHKHKITTNFRERLRNLVVSRNSADVSLLLGTLDGEVRRGDIIAYVAHAYYLYPSALIVARLSLSSKLLIIPAKDIKSLTHKMTHHTLLRRRYTSRYDLFRVCVYGQQQEKLGEVICREDSGAQLLVKALNRNFGVADLGRR